MSLADTEFAFFFPVALLIHWLLPKRSSIQNAYLLALSWIFYALFSAKLLGLLIAGTAIDFALARRLEREDISERDRRLMLIISMTFSVGGLAFFKYLGLFGEVAQRLFSLIGFALDVPTLKLILPLGISFYTLQRLGYVLDVYYRRIPACHNFVTFGVFCAFFPQITAGPISRGGQLLPQLAEDRPLDWERIGKGAGAFLWGFSLKALVADNVGPTLVDPVFTQPQTFGSMSLLCGLLSYAVQIYCDFAGYSLLAIGCGRLVGIELPTNFEHPFLSKSMPEFWRRWHITLNTWLFEFIYAPMVTSRGVLRGRLDVGLMAVFLASGLWHGAAFTFVFWGFLHGVGMVVQRRWDEFYRSLCRKDRKWVARRKSAGYGAAAWLITQLFFVLTLIPFRLSSMSDVESFFSGMLGGQGNGVLVIAGVTGALKIALCFAVFTIDQAAPFSPVTKLRARFFDIPAPVRGVFYGAWIVLLFLFVPVGAGAFIYRNF